MRRLRIALDQIEDLGIREAIRRLFDELFDAPLSGFKGRHFEISKVPGTYTVPHRLGFRPKDIIQTAVLNGTCSWDYDAIDETDITFTLTGTVGESTIVRAYIGSHTED